MVTKNSIKTYLDFAASSPLDPRVFEAMKPHFESNHGNPASIHTFGQRSETAVSTSRDRIAREFNCSPNEIIFTSGGTESDNLALRGVALAQRKLKDATHILISPVEHDAVKVTAKQLAELHGFELEYLEVDEFGRASPENVQAKIRPDTAIVSVIYANNEFGTVNPLHEIAQVCSSNNVPLHTDAVQAAAYFPIDLQSLPVDLLSFGAHKFYGPKGVGGLFIRHGTPILPTQTGGSQESDLRAGTLNVPSIVGMAEALKILKDELSESAAKMTELRDLIIQTVLDQVPNSKLTGHPTERLPNHASFVFKGVDGNELLMMLDVEGFACSSGSACHTGNPKPSENLKALGLDSDWALGSLRVTIGNHTPRTEVDQFLSILPSVIARARSIEAAISNE